MTHEKMSIDFSEQVSEIRQMASSRFDLLSKETEKRLDEYRWVHKNDEEEITKLWEVRIPLVEQFRKEIEIDLKKLFEEREQIYFKKLDADKEEIYKYVTELEEELSRVRSIETKVMTKERK